MTTPIVLLLALVATDVSASRRVDSPCSIKRTIVRVALGVAASLGDERRLGDIAARWEGTLDTATIREPRLYVGGQRAGGLVRGVLQALRAAGLLLLDRADPARDVVELRYTLHAGGFAIARSVRLAPGEVRSTASFPCALGPQGRVRRIAIAALARDKPDGGARVDVTARVEVRTGLFPERSASRCRLVNRAASRAAKRQLDASLAEAVDAVRGLVRAGRDAALEAAARVRQHVVDRWRQGAAA